MARGRQDQTGQEMSWTRRTTPKKIVCVIQGRESAADFCGEYCCGSSPPSRGAWTVSSAGSPP
eukprot:55668-Eustigmatos_ZCMA.PRE.1